MFAVAPMAVAQSGSQNSSRPIKLVVGYSAGSTFDAVARAVVGEASEALGKTIVIDNRTGAAGAVGNQYVAQAAPDGYTLLIGGAGSHAVTPAVKRNLPYDTAKDFTAVVGVARFPLVMVVPTSLPVNNVQEFLEYAKNNPGKVNFGSTGVGTSIHLSGELMKLRTGIDMLHVPYRENGTLKADLQAGRVQVVFDALPAVMGLIEQGALKALAVTTAERSVRLPDVPTMAESGLSDFVVESWLGVFAPAGLSDENKQQYAKAFRDASLSEGGKERLLTVGAEATGLDTAEFEKAWRADMERWKKVVADANVEIDEL